MLGEDSLAAHQELASQEEAFQEYVAEDSELRGRHDAFEDAAGADADAAEQFAVYDSLLASDEEFAGYERDLESELASDEEVLERHQEALLYLGRHPDEAAAFYASAKGPVYRGDHPALLAYVTSYRRHNGFHEACVERMFVDIKERCSPDALTIYARYTRRGGIDINPWRSSAEGSPDNLRLWRQ